MKKIIFCMLCFMSMCFIHAQRVCSKKIPDAVKSSIQKSYPRATDVDWTKEDGMYEAEIDLENDMEMSVLISPNGEIMETETEIKYADLPVKVQEATKGMKCKEASKIVDAKGSISYEVEIKHKDWIFDANGIRIK